MARAATQCAAEQGRFRRFHDALFAEQEVIGEVPWDYFATAAGISDQLAFRELRRDASGVAMDRRLEESIGVDSTPTGF